MKQPERDELLIRLDERTQRMDKSFKQHLQHHFTLTVGVVTTILAGGIGLLVAVLKW